MSLVAKMIINPINYNYVKRHWRRSGAFIANSEHISPLVQVSLLLTMSR